MVVTNGVYKYNELVLYLIKFEFQLQREDECGGVQREADPEGYAGLRGSLQNMQRDASVPSPTLPQHRPYAFVLPPSLAHLSMEVGENSANAEFQQSRLQERDECRSAREAPDII